MAGSRIVFGWRNDLRQAAKHRLPKTQSTSRKTLGAHRNFWLAQNTKQTLYERVRVALECLYYECIVVCAKPRN